MSIQTVPALAYSVEEFMSAARISRAQVYREIRAARLRVVKCGRRTLIPLQAAQQWLDNLADPQATDPQK